MIRRVESVTGKERVAGMQEIPESMSKWPEVRYVPDVAFNIKQDLVEFTGLAGDTVEDLLGRPAGMCFMDEWSATPLPLRHDHWYYLSSSFYLFANAVHKHAPGCGLLKPQDFQGMVPRGAHVLDYAGGTGNCALSMASLGYVVHYRDLSALQAAFVRYRAGKYNLPIVVHEWWEPLPDDFFAFICFDSIGHVVDQKKELTTMTRALKKGGKLFLSLEDFTVPCAYDPSDPRRWSSRGNEQLMHQPNQIGDVSAFLLSEGLEWNPPCWVK